MEGKKGKGRVERRRKRGTGGRWKEVGGGKRLIFTFLLFNNNISISSSLVSHDKDSLLSLCRTTSSLYMRCWHLHPLDDEVIIVQFEFQQFFLANTDQFVIAAAPVHN